VPKTGPKRPGKKRRYAYKAIRSRSYVQSEWCRDIPSHAIPHSQNEKQQHQKSHPKEEDKIRRQSRKIVCIDLKHRRYAQKPNPKDIHPDSKKRGYDKK